jgi:hypothetical protein
MKNVFLFSLFLICGGCLSIGRVPFATHAQYSDDGVRTNCTYTTFIENMNERGILNGVYPTIQMRYIVTKKSPYFDDDFYLDKDGKPVKGETLYYRKQAKYWIWFPLTVIWLTSPLDGIVDTIAIPWDI